MLASELKKVEALAQRFNNDIGEVAKELKSVQSKKCRLRKARRTSTWEKEFKDLLAYEEALKEVRQLLAPKGTPVTRYTQEDVSKLDYDETIKAIKSIQSKKCLSRWLPNPNGGDPVEGDNEEFRNACKIEAMLLEHKKALSPIDEGLYIRKSDLQAIIDTIEASGKLSQAKILELLKGLM